jgi:hypothetical protein
MKFICQICSTIIDYDYICISYCECDNYVLCSDCVHNCEFCYSELCTLCMTQYNEENYCLDCYELVLLKLKKETFVKCRNNIKVCDDVLIYILTFI